MLSRRGILPIRLGMQHNPHFDVRSAASAAARDCSKARLVVGPAFESCLRSNAVCSAGSSRSIMSTKAETFAKSYGGRALSSAMMAAAFMVGTAFAT